MVKPPANGATGLPLTGKAAIQVRFSPSVCRSCPSQAKCTQAQNGARTITFLPQAEPLALQHARQAQDTPEFKAQCAQRIGIEGTISQGVRGFALRSTRYIRLAKTHLQMIATAVAIICIGFSIGGKIPFACTLY